MAIELIIQKTRNKEVKQRECSAPTADDLCSHPHKRMEFWVEATLSAAVSISSHIFQRHMETARWAVPQGQHTLYSTFHSTPGLSKTLRQDLACSSPCEQWCLPVHPLDLEKQAQLKALHLGTLTCFFPCLSHAQLLSLTSISCVGYSWRWFYHTLDFLPFTQALLHIRFVLTQQ